jgi:hypothetical protein
MKYITWILTALLLLCLAPMPYSFYQLFRFVAMILFGILAYRYWVENNKPIAVTFGALVLLFQPFAKISLGREMWNIVDIVVAIGLILLWLYERRTKSKGGA